eukprot:GHVL01043419.1.p1 GENE.GHVL01043419.1~~GHVL01043419.1.p1  ORF type:complete len:1394 (+),score=290.14 GHVL01043419.1:220-4401(+)
MDISNGYIQSSMFSFEYLPPCRDGEIDYTLTSEQIEESRILQKKGQIHSYESPVKSVGPITFKILIYPNSTSAPSDDISLFIKIVPDPEWPSDWTYGCVFQTAVINRKDYRDSPNRTQSFPFRYNSKELDRGFNNICRLPTNPNDVIIGPQGEITVRCQIAVQSELLRGGYIQYNGLKNLGVTCYLNSLLQSLFHLGEFRRSIYLATLDDDRVYENGMDVDTVTDDQKKRTMSLDDAAQADATVVQALQGVFLRLQSEKGPVDCRGLIKSFNWDNYQLMDQQDVQEMLRQLCDKLDELMQGTPAEGYINRLFSGKWDNYIQCLDVDYKSNRAEDFLDIQLSVQGCSSLDESIETLLQAEVMDGANKYRAEGHGLQRARKGVAFSSIPPVLQIHLRRFQYNLATMHMFKVNDYFSFPKYLDMEKYVPGGGEYSLHSVIVHSGSIDSGHYLAFVRPDPDEDQWYRFDDERVTKASEWAAIEDNYGGLENTLLNIFTNSEAKTTEEHLSYCHKQRTNCKVHSAYMLVYLQKKLENDLLKPVLPHEVNPGMVNRLTRQREILESRLQAQRERESKVIIRLVTEENLCKMKGMWQPISEENLPKFQSLKVDRSTTVEDLIREIFREEIGNGMLYVTLFALSFQQMEDHGATLTFMLPNHKVNRYVNKRDLLSTHGGVPVLYVFLTPPRLIFKHPPGIGAHPPGIGAHPPGIGAHPPGIGAHPPGLGAHPLGHGAAQRGAGVSPANLQITANYCTKCYENESTPDLVEGVRNSSDFSHIFPKCMYIRPHSVFLLYFDWKSQDIIWLGMTVSSAVASTADDCSEKDLMNISIKNNLNLIKSAINERIVYFNIEDNKEKIYFLASFFTKRYENRPLRWMVKRVFLHNLDFLDMPSYVLVTQSTPPEKLVEEDRRKENEERTRIEEELNKMDRFVENFINHNSPRTQENLYIYILQLDHPPVNQFADKPMMDGTLISSFSRSRGRKRILNFDEWSVVEQDKISEIRIYVHDPLEALAKPLVLWDRPQKSISNATSGGGSGGGGISPVHSNESGTPGGNMEDEYTSDGTWQLPKEVIILTDNFPIDYEIEKILFEAALKISVPVPWLLCYSSPPHTQGHEMHIHIGDDLTLRNFPIFNSVVEMHLAILPCPSKWLLSGYTPIEPNQPGEPSSEGVSDEGSDEMSDGRRRWRIVCFRFFNKNVQPVTAFVVQLDATNVTVSQVCDVIRCEVNRVGYICSGSLRLFIGDTTVHEDIRANDFFETDPLKENVFASNIRVEEATTPEDDEVMVEVRHSHRDDNSSCRYFGQIFYINCKKECKGSDLKEAIRSKLNVEKDELIRWRLLKVDNSKAFVRDDDTIQFQPADGPQGPEEGENMYSDAYLIVEHDNPHEHTRSRKSQGVVIR